MVVAINLIPVLTLIPIPERTIGTMTTIIKIVTKVTTGQTAATIRATAMAVEDLAITIITETTNVGVMVVVLTMALTVWIAVACGEAMVVDQVWEEVGATVAETTILNLNKTAVAEVAMSTSETTVIIKMEIQTAAVAITVEVIAKKVEATVSATIIQATIDLVGETTTALTTTTITVGTTQAPQMAALEPQCRPPCLAVE